MTASRTKLRALYLVTLVVVSALVAVPLFSSSAGAYSKSTGNVSVGNAPMVGLQDATIDPSNESRIPVSINVSESGLKPSEIRLEAKNTDVNAKANPGINPINTTLLSEADFSSNASNGNLTIKTSPFGQQRSSFTLNVTAYNDNTGQPITGATNESTITIDDTTPPEISDVSLDNNGFDKIKPSFNSSERLGQNPGNLSVTVSGPNGASYSFTGSSFYLADSTDNFTYRYSMDGKSQSFNDGGGTYTAAVDTAEDFYGNDGEASAPTDDYEFTTDFSSKTVKNRAGGPDLDTSNVTMYTTKFRNKLVFVRLENDTSSFDRRDLAGEGATENTELWVNFTVDAFNPDALMGTANVQSWNYTMNDDGSANVNVSLKPASTERNFSAWRSGVRDPANWGANYEGSDLSMDAVIDFGIGNMSGQGSPQGLDGARLTSDAQSYTVPSIDDNGNLSIDVASPHCVASTSPPADQCSGDEVNNGGFYKAVIPSAFYQNEWGVNELSAGDIDVQYSSGGSTSTDTQWDITVREDGAIVLNGTNLHYSEGTVNIIQSESSDSGGSDGGDSGGGGSGISTDVTTEQSESGTAATIDGVKVNEPTVSVPIEDVSTDEVSVTEASVTFTKGSNSETRVAVSASELRPSQVPQPSAGRVVGFVEVNVEGSLEDGVAAGSFTLDFAGSDITPAAVTVHRYHDGEWQRVETTVVDETTVEVHTPGFSVFAVDVADRTTTATATATPTATQPATPTTAVSRTAPETASPRASRDSRTDRAAEATVAGNAGADRSTGSAVPTSTPNGQPGFGILVGLLAIVAVLFAGPRRHR